MRSTEAAVAVAISIDSICFTSLWLFTHSKWVEGQNSWLGDRYALTVPVLSPTASPPWFVSRNHAATVRDQSASLWQLRDARCFFYRDCTFIITGKKWTSQCYCVLDYSVPTDFRALLKHALIRYSGISSLILLSFVPFSISHFPLWNVSFVLRAFFT